MDSPELETAWQQPLTRTDVCDGKATRCALGWGYGSSPSLDIAPFTGTDYQVTLSVGTNADDYEGETKMTFQGAEGHCERFDGRVEWTVRPPEPRGQRERFAFHVDARCTDPSGTPGLRVVADVRGTRDDRPLTPK
jgi:hypothetical protein